MAITRENLRAYLDRPWANLRVMKDRHTARLIEREGASTAFRLAQDLREYATMMGAAPTKTELRDDLAAAVRLRSLLDRAAKNSSSRTR